MKAGAVEFLTKPLVEGDVLESIRQAIARDRATREHLAATAELRDRHASLTPREEEVLGWVVSGLLNKQIASELGISEETVKVHRGNVMRRWSRLLPTWSNSERLGIPIGNSVTRPGLKAGSRLMPQGSVRSSGLLEGCFSA